MSELAPLSFMVSADTAYIRVYHTWMSEEGVKSLGTGVMDGCELPSGFWKSNLDPSQAQQGLLTLEPSF